LNAIQGRKKISVLIPVLEPREELPVVHAEAIAELDKLEMEYEFLYLVSRKSASVTEKIRDLQRENPERIRVIEVGHSVGGAAILAAGIEETEGDILFTLPPCYEVELDVIAELYKAIESGADLAFARRSPREGASARIQSRIFNKLIAWAAGASFADITSDTRAIRREVLQEISLYGDFHRYLPVLAERAGFCVREISAREHLKARAVVYGPADYLWRALDILSIFFLSRFTRHPLRLFGGVGCLFGAVGGVILALVSFQRLVLDVALADRPILVLSALLFGLGVQLFTIGLLGELILFFHARNIRDYRIAAVYEAGEPALPESSSSSSRHGTDSPPLPGAS
jgi:hypothetical protein